MSSTSTAANIRLETIADGPARLRPVLPASDRRTDPAAERADAAARASASPRAARRFTLGIAIFTLGLVKKLVFADRSREPSTGSMQHGAAAASEHLLAIYGFSVQIYCDFSGYTDMAIGLAYLLRVRLPTNFLRPYTAPSIVDFWRRWHITLSHWLRDYLYIPLGGNRGGKARADPQHHGHDAARRPVARRELDVRDLGRAAWRGARFRASGLAAHGRLAPLAVLVVDLPLCDLRVDFLPRKGFCIRTAFHRGGVHEHVEHGRRRRRTQCLRGHPDRRVRAHARPRPSCAAANAVRRANPLFVWLAIAFCWMLAITISQGSSANFIYFDF